MSMVAKMLLMLVETTTIIIILRCHLVIQLSQVARQVRWHHGYKNGLDATRQIYQMEGLVKGIYRGYGATLASFGPFSAFYFVFYEYITGDSKLL